MEQTDQKLPVLSSDELGYTLPTVARLYYTGIGQRYKRASVRPGQGDPLCLKTEAERIILHAVSLAVAAERERGIATAAVEVREVSTCSGAACQALRAALSIVREYPDFDEGGPLPEMMDQFLRGEPSPMLAAL